MVSFIIFKTTVPEGTPLSLLLVRWGSLFFSYFILYSPTTTDIYPLFTCDPLQTIILYSTDRDTIYIFHLLPVQGGGLPPRKPDLFTL